MAALLSLVIERPLLLLLLALGLWAQLALLRSVLR